MLLNLWKLIQDHHRNNEKYHLLYEIPGSKTDTKMAHGLILKNIYDTLG